MSDWTDRIVGDRMVVDGEFASEVEASEFSRQEWGLVMTAVEFEIEGAEDPETARLVAKTDDLEAVLPEVERVAKMQQQARGQTGSGGGVLESLRNALGMGNGSDRPDEERAAAARDLTQRYATRLQEHLESRGKWADVCASARD